MSIDDRETTLRPQPDVTAQPSRRRWWSTVWGLLSIVLGVIAIVAAFWATLATVLFFAVLLTLVGISQIVDATTSRDEPGFAWRLGIGILTAVVGAMILLDPVGGAIGLTLLLAIFFISAGVFRLILASQLSGNGKGWFAASGVLDLVLGVLILLHWPASGVWVIGLFLGIDLIVFGLAIVMLAAQNPYFSSYSPNAQLEQ